MCTVIGYGVCMSRSAKTKSFRITPRLSAWSSSWLPLRTVPRGTSEDALGAYLEHALALLWRCHPRSSELAHATPQDVGDAAEKLTEAIKAALEGGRHAPAPPARAAARAAARKAAEQSAAA